MGKIAKSSIIVFMSTFLLFTGCAKSENKENKTVSSEQVVATVQKISAKEAKEKIDSGQKVIILDVREQSEYDDGHIKDSVLLPVGSIESNIDKVITKEENKETPILVYCRSGNRSAKAAKALTSLGYTNVYDFGGIIDWPYDIEK